MTSHIHITVKDILPDMAGVLETQGVPRGKEAPQKVKNLYDAAETEFLSHAEPANIIKTISIQEFAEIYDGEGKNEPGSQLENVFPKASHTALFAFTQGAAVSNRIEYLQKHGELALGYMLDVIASFSTDKAATFASERFNENLQTQNPTMPPTKALLYSPGYCGWHITGQHKLFARLQPEQIGIKLLESSLMSPLKSISGILIAGEPRIHRFTNNLPYCAACKSKNCLERMEAIGA